MKKRTHLIFSIIGTLVVLGLIYWAETIYNTGTMTQLVNDRFVVLVGLSAGLTLGFGWIRYFADV